MRTATIADFRKKMKSYLNAVESDQDILILSGPKQKTFVILPLELFNAMQETAHLLSTSNNTIRLMDSIKQVKEGLL
jgi:antitoxin YefM